MRRQFYLALFMPNGGIRDRVRLVHRDVDPHKTPDWILGHYAKVHAPRPDNPLG
jgi:hypothetical protein